MGAVKDAVQAAQSQTTQQYLFHFVTVLGAQLVIIFFTTSYTNFTNHRCHTVEDGVTLNRLTVQEKQWLYYPLQGIVNQTAEITYTLRFQRKDFISIKPEKPRRLSNRNSSGTRALFCNVKFHLRNSYSSQAQ